MHKKIIKKHYKKAYVYKTLPIVIRNVIILFENKVKNE